MKTKLLANDFAVEIQDVDLESLDDATFDALREVWMRYKVAVFRDQVISDEALIDFTKRLGPLFVHVRDESHDLHRPEMMFVSNVKEEGKGNGILGNGDLRWHTDQSYTPRPERAECQPNRSLPR